LQATRIAPYRPDRGFEHGIELDALGFRGGPYRLQCRFNERDEIDTLHIQTHLAGDDAAHVEKIIDDLRLRTGVALDHCDRLGSFGRQSR